MLMMQQVAENALIARLTSLFPHSPLRLNGIQESDAELVRFPGSDRILAITTDAIVEEIDAGLYSDPYLVGWMTVMASISDLAAVGAEPIGLLIAESLPRDTPDADIVALQKGIGDACTHTGTFVLGGDTNFSDRLHTTGMAIGSIPAGSSLTRIGCSPGEILYCTGPLGSGNAFAALQMSGIQSPENFSYRPVARIREGISLRSHASVCMDTSDGLFATLDQIGRLNNCGFHLEDGWEQHIATGALSVASLAGIGPWMLLAGPHGEFELAFTVPEQRTTELHSAAEQAGWVPVRLGLVSDRPGIRLESWGTLDPDDLASIRNHPLRNKSDIRKFLRFLAVLADKRRNSTKP
jgi:thiamine-monophosphate kinase